MANFYGTSRTNYVRVKDVDAALKDLEPFNNQVHRHPTEADAVMVSGDDDGTFSTTAYDDEDNREIYLEWADWCAAHLKEGQVMVLVTAGAEKLRYVSAWAEAYDHTGKGGVSLNLDTSLRDLIRAQFGHTKYADPTYQEVL